MIKEELMTDMKNFMKEKNQAALNAVKLLNAEIKKIEIDTRKTLDDEKIIGIINKQIKMRKDSITQFENAGRPELAENEKLEITFLEKYLPKQMTDEELGNEIRKIIAELNITEAKQFGLAMKETIKRVGSKADNSRISSAIKEILK